MPASTTKDARLELRITGRHKKLLERAAALEGCSTTQFVVSQAVAAAEGVLEKQHALVMSQRDLERFLQAIDETGEPTAEAKRLNRGRLVGSSYEC
ncbi:MAG: DUF1778 domain-containing protein [Armatimonadetes bacterium]|nr:DUF1778 domain-containing protein [Armatimonadota bacterium]